MIGYRPRATGDRVVTIAIEVVTGAEDDARGGGARARRWCDVATAGWASGTERALGEGVDDRDLDRWRIVGKIRSIEGFG